MVTDDILRSIDSAVLCWLATASADSFPNVSPKEIFCWQEDHFLIANIASPGSVKNIKQNAQVCVSFIDILSQKGYQLKGTAEIIDKSHDSFDKLSKPLMVKTKGLYPFSSITSIDISSTKEIVAPSYMFYPEISIETKIQSAKEQYGLL